MIQKAKKLIEGLLFDPPNQIWEKLSAALGVLLIALFPHLAVYAVAPYITCCVFYKNELRSLGIFTLIGLVLDGMSSANFFGFFCLALPVTGAFIYSLKHFFQPNSKSAGVFCFLFSFIVTFSEMITVHFFLKAPALFFVEYLVYLAIYPGLAALLCTRFYKIEKKHLTSL